MKLTRGFSLTEMAIVLSVVGLILGGIWSAASSVNRNAKQEKFTEELTNIAAGVRSAYTGQAYFGSTPTPSNLMPKLTGLNVFPNDEVHINGGKAAVDSPFGEFTNPNSSTYNSLYVCGWQSSPAAGQTCFTEAAAADMPLFAIEVLLPMGADCIQAVIKNADPTKLTGLLAVYVNGNPMSFPPVPATVAANCAAATPVIVDYVFRLMI